MDIVETTKEVEGLTFKQQLVLLREHKTDLEQVQSLEPKKANTPLTFQIQELIKLENQILKLVGSRVVI